MIVVNKRPQGMTGSVSQPKFNTDKKALKQKKEDPIDLEISSFNISQDSLISKEDNNKNLKKGRTNSCGRELLIRHLPSASPNIPSQNKLKQSTNKLACEMKQVGRYSRQAQKRSSKNLESLTSPERYYIQKLKAQTKLRQDNGFDYSASQSPGLKRNSQFIKHEGITNQDEAFKAIINQKRKTQKYQLSGFVQSPLSKQKNRGDSNDASPFGVGEGGEFSTFFHKRISQERGMEQIAGNLLKTSQESGNSRMPRYLLKVQNEVDNSVHSNHLQLPIQAGKGIRNQIAYFHHSPTLEKQQKLQVFPDNKGEKSLQARIKLKPIGDNGIDFNRLKQIEEQLRKRRQSRIKNHQFDA